MGYHVHVYFDDSTEAQALELRSKIERHPANDGLGRFHPAPIGPHPCRQFQVLVSDVHLESFISWLDGERDGLTVFFHPDIDDDMLAHTDLARWLGEPHVLRLDRFT
jgi:aromatic ring-cleaving dioxygenase